MFKLRDIDPICSVDARTYGLLRSLYIVSSESKTHEAGKGRLNGKAWHAQELGPNEYLQIRFHTNVNITAIATRGDGDSGFVKSYTLSYSNDGDVWRTFLDAADASKTKV